MSDTSGNTGIGDFGTEKPEKKNTNEPVLNLPKKKRAKRSKKSRENLKDVVKESKVENLAKERSVLKEDVSKADNVAKADDEPEKKPKRRRRRKKKPVESIEELPKVERVSEPAPVDKVNPVDEPDQGPINPFNDVVESVPDYQDEVLPPSPPPVQPVNPFMADSYLPPKEYEDRYHNNDEAVNAPISPFTENTPPKEFVEPVDPFKSDDFPVGKTTLDEKALDDKPLDELIDEHIAKDEEEKISPEEYGEAEEIFPELQDNTEEVSLSGSGNEKADANVNEVNEIIDVEPVEDVKNDDLFEPAKVENLDNMPKAEIAEFKENFWDVLEQAGITKKKIIIFLISLGVLIFVFAFFLMRGGDNDVSEVENTDTDTVSEFNVPEAGVYSLVSSYIFGLEYSLPVEPIEARPIGALGDASSIDAALAFGDTKGALGEKFIGYIDLLRKLQNIYQTDVYAMMDSSLDRRAVLNSHIVEMDNLITLTVQAIADIDSDMERLSSEYTQVAEEKELFEKAFFSTAQELYGVQAKQNLDFFVEAGKRAGEIKARHTADSTVRNMLVNSLSVLQPRYQDIQSNTDALVKGVKIFDIPGSDIKAIIRLNK